MLLTASILPRKTVVDALASIRREWEPENPYETLIGREGDLALILSDLCGLLHLDLIETRSVLGQPTFDKLVDLGVLMDTIDLPEDVLVAQQLAFEQATDPNFFCGVPEGV